MRADADADDDEGGESVDRMGEGAIGAIGWWWGHGWEGREGRNAMVGFFFVSSTHVRGK